MPAPDFHFWLYKYKNGALDTPLSWNEAKNMKAMVLDGMRQMTADDMSVKDLRRVARWLWAYGTTPPEEPQVSRGKAKSKDNAKAKTVRDLSWTHDAFSASTPYTMEQRLLGMLVVWQQLPSVLYMTMPGYEARVLGHQTPGGGVAQALSVSDDPSWWRLCLEHEFTLDDARYESKVRALCVRVLPEHRYVAMAQGLDVSLDHVLQAPVLQAGVASVQGQDLFHSSEHGG